MLSFVECLALALLKPLLQMMCYDDSCRSSLYLIYLLLWCVADWIFWVAVRWPPSAAEMGWPGSSTEETAWQTCWVSIAVLWCDVLCEQRHVHSGCSGPVKSRTHMHPYLHQFNDHLDVGSHFSSELGFVLSPWFCLHFRMKARYDLNCVEIANKLQPTNYFRMTIYVENLVISWFWQISGDVSDFIKSQWTVVEILSGKSVCC